MSTIEGYHGERVKLPDGSMLELTGESTDIYCPQPGVWLKLRLDGPLGVQEFDLPLYLPLARTLLDALNRCVLVAEGNTIELPSEEAK